MRIHQVTFTNEGLTIAYVNENDQDADTGITEVRVLEIPHAVLSPALLEDLVDSVLTIVEEARVLRRHPAEQFTHGARQ
jgi:hypothetical protein